MNNQELVSVVITTHNRIDLLPIAIESVLKQTYKNIECIVVSDASTDSTDRYCSKRTDIKYIRIPKKESGGGNHARNVGIQNANGSMVAFLDDDDYWLPTKLEKQVALMNETNSGFVYCGRTKEFIQKDGSKKSMLHMPQPEMKGDVSRRILYNIATTTSCILVKKELLYEVGLYDENLRFWQEYELSIRLAQVTSFNFVNEPLCIYRVDYQDPNRLTNKYDIWKKVVNQIYTKHENLYKTISLNEKRLYKLMVVKDSITRCQSAGLKYKAIGFRLLMYILDLPHYILRMLKIK